MTAKITYKQVHMLALKVDKYRGNNNQIIDTDDERSIFADQLRKYGIKGADTLVHNYTNDSLKYLAQFNKDGVNDKNKVNYEIYKALNPNAKLDLGKYSQKDIDKTIDNIYDAVTGWSFLHLGTRENQLEDNILGKDDEDEKIQGIDKDNVMQILKGYKAKHGESLAEAITGDTSGEFHEKLATAVIDALVAKADELGIDVTSIITKDGEGSYVVVNVAGIKPEEPATSEDNFAKVVNSLQNRIKTGLALALGDKAGKGFAEKDKNTALLMLARQADADGNGVLEGDEVGSFKKFCANIGIIVNDILASMKGKDENSYTDDEKIIKNIFSSDGYVSVYKQQQYVATKGNAITTAINDNDDEALENIVSAENITEDNVEEILSKISDEYEVYNTTGTTTPGVVITNSYATSTLKKLLSKDSKYAEVILKALIEKADSKGVDYSDIVTESNGYFYNADGNDATQTQYSYDVINKLRKAIKDQGKDDIELL